MFQDFRPAFAMFIFSVFCHVLASFYAFLRHDFFHAVQFAVYFVFWMSRGLLQLLMSLDGFGNEALVQRINFYGQWAIVILLMVVTLSSIIFARVSPLRLLLRLLLLVFLFLLLLLFLFSSSFFFPLLLLLRGRRRCRRRLLPPVHFNYLVALRSTVASAGAIGR